MFKKSMLFTAVVLGVGQGSAFALQPLGDAPVVVCESSKIKFLYLQGELPVAAKTLVLRPGSKLEVEWVLVTKEVSALLAKRVSTTILFKHPVAEHSFVVKVNFYKEMCDVTICGEWEKVPGIVLEFVKKFVNQKSGMRTALEATVKVVGGAAVGSVASAMVVGAMGKRERRLLIDGLPSNSELPVDSTQAPGSVPAFGGADDVLQGAPGPSAGFGAGVLFGNPHGDGPQVNQPGVAPTAASTPAPAWMCSACTYSNAATAPSCSLCTTARPATQNAVPAAPAAISVLVYGPDSPRGSGRRLPEAGFGAAASRPIDEALTGNAAAAARVLQQALDSYLFPRDVTDFSDIRLGAMIQSNDFSELPDFPENIEVLPGCNQIFPNVYLGNSGFTEQLLLANGTREHPMPQDLFDLVITVASERSNAFARAHWAPFATCTPPSRDMKIKGVDYLFLPIHEGMCYFVDACTKGTLNTVKGDGTARLACDYYRDVDDDVFHKEFFPNAEQVFQKIDAIVAYNATPQSVKKKKVLVHCSNGSHRSASVLFAYIASRVPSASCWKINSFLRNKRHLVHDAKFRLARGGVSNMMKQAIHHYAYIRSHVGAMCPACV